MKIKLTKTLLNKHSVYLCKTYDFIGNGDYMLSKDFVSVCNYPAKVVSMKEIFSVLKNQKSYDFEIVDKVQDDKEVFIQTKYDEFHYTTSAINRLYYEQIIKPMAEVKGVSLKVTFGVYNSILISYNNRLVGVILLSRVKV